jgi:hypothetical protein
MKILPGMISDPGWTGPRCASCSRPIGGDGSIMMTCEDMPQAHMTLDRIPQASVYAFYRTSVLRDVKQAFSDELDAIDWMKAPRGLDGIDAVAMLRSGRGDKVLEALHAEFPILAKIEEGVARQAAALRSVG